MVASFSYDTAANWASSNPVLLAGEQAYESDTYRYKIGDGATPYNSLLYADSPSGLPGYVTGKGKYSYSTVENVYNWKGSNTRKIRTSLSRARAGNGTAHWGVYGESTSAGFDGTSLKGTKAWPYVLASYFSQYQGVPLGGDGTVNAGDAASGGTNDTRWTYAGGWATTGWYQFAATTTGGTATYVTTRTGANQCKVFYDDASGKANFSWSMDSGAQTGTVTIGSTNTIKSFTVSGLNTATTHTLVITATTTDVLYTIQWVNTTTGFHMHNLSRSSSGLDSGGSAGNIPGVAGAWNDTTSYYSIGQQAWASLTGITLDCVISMQGINDVYPSGTYPSGQYTPAQTITALQNELTNHHGTADILLVLTPQLSGLTYATWADFGNRLYALAETLDCPLLDLWDRSGDYTAMGNNGEIGADSLHPTTTWHDEVAQAVSQLVAA